MPNNNSELQEVIIPFGSFGVKVADNNVMPVVLLKCDHEF